MTIRIADPRPALTAAETRVEEALIAHGLPGRVTVLAELATTAPMAAEAVGCEVGMIVKSLCFLGAETGRAHMLLVSGANRVHEKRAGKLIGEKLVRADADAVKAATGFSIGGVSPFALATEMPVWLDEDLLAFDLVWAAAGNPRSVAPVAPQALAEAVGATVIKVT